MQQNVLYQTHIANAKENVDKVSPMNRAADPAFNLFFFGSRNETNRTHTTHTPRYLVRFLVVLFFVLGTEIA